MDNETMEKIINELENRIRDAGNIDDHNVVFELECFLEWFEDEFHTSSWVECDEHNMKLNHRINNDGEREYGYTCHKCGYSEWDEE